MSWLILSANFFPEFLAKLLATVLKSFCKIILPPQQQQGTSWIFFVTNAPVEHTKPNEMPWLAAKYERSAAPASVIGCFGCIAEGSAFLSTDNDCLCTGLKLTDDTGVIAINNTLSFIYTLILP